MDKMSMNYPQFLFMLELQQEGIIMHITMTFLHKIEIILMISMSVKTKKIQKLFSGIKQRYYSQVITYVVMQMLNIKN